MNAQRAWQILVTGGTGMIGAALVRRLVDEGEAVTVFVRRSATCVRLHGLEERVRFLTGDIGDAAAVRAAIEQTRPDVVYHLASTPFNPPTISAQAHVDTIVNGTLHVLEAVKDQPGVRVIAAGSAAEYGSGSHLREDHLLAPTTVLGAAKAAATLLLQTYARLHGLQTVILRIFTPYGPWEHPRRLIPYTILSALNHEPLTLTSGEQQRDYFYLDDLVDALRFAAVKSIAPGTTLNLCSGRAVTVRHVVERVLELMGRPVPAQFGVRPTRPDELREMSGDTTAVRTRLGWEPRTGLDEGLRKTIAWWTAHREAADRLLEAEVQPSESLAPALRLRME